MNALDEKIIRIASASRWRQSFLAKNGKTPQERKIASFCLVLNKALDRAVRDEEEKWVTINGARVLIKNGQAVAGPKNLTKEINNEKSSEYSEGKKESAAKSTHVSQPAKPAPSRKISSKDFVPALKKAKESCNPKIAWRVDSSRTEHDFDNEGATLYTTEGGSTFAIKKDGDIISVCKHFGGNDHGKDVMAAAVAAGGNHLDSFDGNYKFYTSCGFEVVSRCKFDEQYAPEGWTKGRDNPEDIIFMKYVGIGNVKDKSIEDMRNRVPYAKDYDDAAKLLDDAMSGGESE